MSAGLYFPIFILSMSAIALFFGAHYMASGTYDLQEKGYRNSFVAFLICIVLIFWLGNRPISMMFGDTVNYARGYLRLEEGYDDDLDFKSEWLFYGIMSLCYKFGFSVSGFFTVIEFGYIISAFYAVKILMPKNVLLGMLFIFASFSFFTFGVNGMRNGLACHLLLLAIALYLDGVKAISFLFLLLAFSCHKSVIIPIAAFFASIYIIKDPKIAIYIWIASIFASFFSGYFFVNLISGLGFDERVGQYLTVSDGQALATTTTAFRWDFLLYSSMPVLITWVVCVKREVTDDWFKIIAITYILANAFWVLVIRASFTNRFAYLSWFLYPVVIAYPLIMLPVWEDQDNKIGVILFGYVFLTLAICYFTGLL